jgi:hypothetical protein
MGNAPFVFRQYGYVVVELYHFERNHQGLGNRLIIAPAATVQTAGRVRRKQRLGGLLNYYDRVGA